MRCWLQCSLTVLALSYEVIPRPALGQVRTFDESPIGSLDVFSVALARMRLNLPLTRRYGIPRRTRVVVRDSCDTPFRWCRPRGGRSLGYRLLRRSRSLGYRLLRRSRSLVHCLRWFHNGILCE